MADAAKKAPAKKVATDKIRAEAEKYTEAADAAIGLITVTLEGRAGTAELEVLPVLDWSDDWQECLSSQNMRGWARGCLTRESFEKWVECAPNIRQGVAFYAAWGDALGEEPGESSAS